MLPPQQSRRALLRLFRKEQIAELETLFRALQTRSRMSVFRRLSAFGYLSSYSHAGRYYTILEIPTFDEYGLWRCRGVGFSRVGSLKRTVEFLVTASDAGQTQAELAMRLGVRVYNTLLDLIESEKIRREPLTGHYLYVSAKRSAAKAQLARRRTAMDALSTRATGAPSEVVVDVLLRGDPRRRSPTGCADHRARAHPTRWSR